MIKRDILLAASGIIKRSIMAGLFAEHQTLIRASNH